jgi:adenylate cyclase
MIFNTNSDKPQKRGFRLHITITFVFVILTLPVTVIFGLITYRANQQLIADEIDRFAQKTASDTASNSLKLLSPMMNAMRSASTLMRDNAEYFASESSADYMQEILISQAGIHSVYAVFEDGAFRQIRRGIKGEAVFGKPIPADTQFISRFVDTRSAAPFDSYAFHSHWGIKTAEESGPVNEDLRPRDFYKNSVAQKAANISDPYPLAGSGELGVTISAPAGTDARVMGVVALDLTLKTLSSHLAETRATVNSITIMSDESGSVIAHPVYELGLSRKGNDIVPARINKLLDQRVLTALGERLRLGRTHFVFIAPNDKVEYLATFNAIPKEFGKTWETVTITPTVDFVGEIQRNNRNLLLFSLIAFFLQIGLIYMIARMIARPIEQLAAEVLHIREFRFDKIKHINSPVYEIRHLSDALGMLERALASFVSYVPTVLVKQLLESGQGARLGVESRFLTMFFTDIEGFSTLAETEPSQQLLTRVSDYFATLTKAIEREEGTVDKFIGDAVMAFWGAPKVSDYHAYHACVAAVRAQRGMMKLNMEWAQQKMPPLKVRIGIHADAVLVGNIGSPERVSYTVMGDGVNIAARLEGLNKELGTWTCVSHNVFREAGHLLWLRPIDTVAVKGRKGEFLVYELVGVRSEDIELRPTENEMLICESTREAYELYANGHFEKAAAAYARIAERFPDDPVAKRMLEKSNARRVKTAYA